MQLFLPSPLLIFLLYESVHNIPPYKVLTSSSKYEIYKTTQQINHTCKQESSKKPPEHPHPVNEALQEPLGCVNPGGHLLLVLGEGSKERQAFHQAGYWRFKQLIRLWGRLVGRFTYSGMFVQDLAVAHLPRKPLLYTPVLKPCFGPLPKKSTEPGPQCGQTSAIVLGRDFWEKLFWPNTYSRDL